MRQLKITKSITNRENASLDKYLAEIARKDLITTDEEIVLARKIREGDTAALEKLATANLRFVVSVAKQYQNQGLSLPDLINEGNIGLLKAAKRFDETRGFKFISYAVWWIRQGIIQAVAEQSRVIRLPLNKVAAINKIRKMQAVLEQELERQPTASELSEGLSVSVQEINTTISVSAWAVSTDAPFSGSEELRYTDVLADPNSVQPDALLNLDSLSIDIHRALETLTEKERTIVSQFYGIGLPHPLTLEEIAGKFEMTRERVRQIKEKAIRRLRQTSRNKILQTYLG